MTRNRSCLLLGLLGAHALASRSLGAAPGGPFDPLPAGSSEVDAADEPLPQEPRSPAHACDVSPFSSDVSERCATPRPGAVSGGYLALDVGVVGISPSAAERVGIADLGPILNVRLGLEFGDVLVLGLGIAPLSLHDKQPYSELVVDCTTVDGTIVDCGSTPHSEDSTVGAALFTMEAGLQHRFRPWRSTSWSPGMMLGYSTTVKGLNRSVDCADCKSMRLDLVTASPYLAPFFRVTFGQMGNMAAVLRSSWFLRGDIVHVTTLGIEIFAP